MNGAAPRLLVLLLFVCLAPFEATAKRHCLASSGDAADLVKQLAATAYAQVHRTQAGKPCFGLFAGRKDAAATRDWFARDRRRAAWKTLQPHALPATLALRQPAFVGAPGEADGSMAFMEVSRGTRRDVVVVYVFDTLEQEPAPGPLWVLDGPSRRIHRTSAWSAALSHDQQQVLYGIPVRLTRDDIEPDGAQYQKRLARGRARVAKRLGVTVAVLKAAEFQDGFAGFSSVVQPAVLDLKTGRARRLKLVGGGTWHLYRKHLYAQQRPWYWESLQEMDPDDISLKPTAPRRLELQPTARWVVPHRKNHAAITASKDARKQVVSLPDDKLPAVGAPYITTPDKRLALIVVKGAILQAARLPAPVSKAR